MRVDVEDKDQLAPEVEHEQQPDKVEALAQERRDEDGEHAVVDVEEDVGGAVAHFTAVTELLQRILDGEDVDEDHVAELTDEERDALDAMESAVLGRDRKSGTLIYAEDRLDLLNRALAVLQPTLALALTPALDEMRDRFDHLVVEVSELRDELVSLEDAQDELFEQDRGKPEDVGVPDEPADTDEKPDGEPDEDEDKDGGTQRPSTLTGKPGEPAVEPRPFATTLTGKPGEPAVEKPSVPSTVYTPEPAVPATAPAPGRKGG